MVSVKPGFLARLAFSVVSKLLVAVPFHQSDDADDNKIITWNGRKGIYTTLPDNVIARWPEETS